MYLHIGKDTLIRQRDIIAIFDMENATVSSITKDFIHEKKNRIRIENVCDDIPKSFVLCEKNKEYILYISQLSSQTLLGRINKSSLGINLE